MEVNMKLEWFERGEVRVWIYSLQTIGCFLIQKPKPKIRG